MPAAVCQHETHLHPAHAFSILH